MAYEIFNTFPAYYEFILHIIADFIQKTVSNSDSITTFLLRSMYSRNKIVKNGWIERGNKVTQLWEFTLFGCGYEAEMCRLQYLH